MDMNLPDTVLLPRVGYYCGLGNLYFHSFDAYCLRDQPEPDSLAMQEPHQLIVAWEVGHRPGQWDGWAYLRSLDEFTWMATARNPVRCKLL
jgi:hypothetical protein